MPAVSLLSAELAPRQRTTLRFDLHQPCRLKAVTFGPTTCRVWQVRIPGEQGMEPVDRELVYRQGLELNPDEPRRVRHDVELRAGVIEIEFMNDSEAESAGTGDVLIEYEPITR